MWQRIVLYCIARLSLVLSVFRLFFLVFVCRSHEYHIVRCYILLRPYDFCNGAWQHDSSDSVVRGSEQIKRQREKTRQFEHSGWCMGFLKIESKSKSRTKRYEQKRTYYAGSSCHTDHSQCLHISMRIWLYECDSRCAMLGSCELWCHSNAYGTRNE